MGTTSILLVKSFLLFFFKTFLLELIISLPLILLFNDKFPVDNLNLSKLSFVFKKFFHNSYQVSFSSKKTYPVGPSYIGNIDIGKLNTSAKFKFSFLKNLTTSSLLKQKSKLPKNRLVLLASLLIFIKLIILFKSIL